MIYKNDGIILKRHVNYYDFIRFRILHGIDTYSDIVLRIGDLIDIKDTNDSENWSYALIRAIMTHKDDLDYVNAFLLINQFNNNDTINPITHFSIYKWQNDLELHYWLTTKDTFCLQMWSALQRGKS